jgi:hypothetical protein
MTGGGRAGTESILAMGSWELAFCDFFLPAGRNLVEPPPAPGTMAPHETSVHLGIAPRMPQVTWEMGCAQIARGDCALVAGGFGLS